MTKFINFKRVSSLVYNQVRNLNLQEYQSKELMSKYGIRIQNFEIASNYQDAEKISKSMKVPEYVIKAQILAGGRGKGTFVNGFKGGVHLTTDPKDIPKLVNSMINQRLVTKQTSPEGVLVKKVMVAQALDITKETYLAFVLDRASQGLMLICSAEGGVDIEEVAKSNPNSILKMEIDMEKGISDSQGARVAKHLGFLKPGQPEDLTKQLQRLYSLFVEKDCTQVEINPLGETSTGEIVCFDAKLNFDDNASFRQKAVFDLFDPEAEEQDPRETAALKNGLSYIGLDGDIGCVVNGAGLAMATMDVVKLHGGEPANFLDLGGGVTVAQTEQAFRIMSSDKRVRAIFVNIFGGIVNCATVASGLVQACKNLQEVGQGLTVPIIVRLEGTNVGEARKIIASSGLASLKACDSFDKAAQMVVQCARDNL